jgi:signal transduction histidine kinase
LTTPDRPKGLQHTLNNPLAALLAELQLLEMEELPPEHRASVERAIELCRRLVRIVREQVPADRV